MEILKIHLRNKRNKVSEEDLGKVAQLTDGFSGAELENLVNLAALKGVKDAVHSKKREFILEGKDFIEFTTKHILST